MRSDEPRSDFWRPWLTAAVRAPFRKAGGVLSALLVLGGGLAWGRQILYTTLGTGAATHGGVQTALMNAGQGVIGEARLAGKGIHAGIAPLVLRSTTPKAKGHWDGDDDFDLRDLAFFMAECFNGPRGAVRQQCRRAFDFARDQDVDLLDWKAVGRDHLMTGPRP
jgi:hypothetical protein